MMTWILILYGTIFFIGLILNTVKLFKTFKRMNRGYTNLCIQYSTGNCILALLLGTLGVLAARLSNASVEAGLEVFLFSVIVYIITTVTLSYFSMVLEMTISLSRKLDKQFWLRFCLALIAFSPMGTSGAIAGVSSNQGRLVGAKSISVTLIIIAVLSLVFIFLFLRKARLLQIAISPIFEQHSKVAANTKNDGLKNHIDPQSVHDVRDGTGANENRIAVTHSLKSSLRRTEPTLKDAAQRSVCFFIGKETEIWRREKEIRRIEKERDKALLFIVLMLCYSFCFVPFCFVLLWSRSFSLQSLGCRIGYTIAASFAILEPVVYLTYMGYKACDV